MTRRWASISPWALAIFFWSRRVEQCSTLSETQAHHYLFLPSHPSTVKEGRDKSHIDQPSHPLCITATDDKKEHNNGTKSLKTRARASTLYSIDIFILRNTSDTNTSNTFDIPYQHIYLTEKIHRAEVFSSACNKTFSVKRWHFQLAKTHWWTYSLTNSRRNMQLVITNENNVCSKIG